MFAGCVRLDAGHNCCCLECHYGHYASKNRLLCLHHEFVAVGVVETRFVGHHGECD